MQAAGLAEFIRAIPGLSHYLPHPMRFPVRRFALRHFVLCLLAAACPAHAEVAKPKVTAPVVAEMVYAPTDLAKLQPRVGRRVVLEGVIVAVGKSRSGATSYLNFTKAYRDSVSLVFLGAALAKDFPKERLNGYIGKKIHIGGILEERNGALQMRVLDAEQIRLLK
jgi:hypothetical protein